MIKQLIISILLVVSCNATLFGAVLGNGDNSIQVSLDNSLEKAITEKSITPLAKAEKEMASKKGNLWTYWKAYVQMCKSVYFISVNQFDEARKALDIGIGMLEKNDNITTEDYALLAYMQSQAIRYTKGMESGVLVAKSRKNAKFSITKDANNIRGWVVLAMIDYYTPKQFGGKEKCEEYLLKAITLPSQSVKNAYRPSWGKVEAYSLLLAYYNEMGCTDKVRKYYQMAIKEFPNEPAFKRYEKL